jgi:hypothetical protein
MAYWRAMIETASGLVKPVQFETPSIVRQDAIGQCQSMYGARRVVVCNPISLSQYHGDGYSRKCFQNAKRSGNPFVTCVLLLIVLLISYWPAVVGLMALFLAVSFFA